MQLIENDRYAAAAGYIAASVLLSITACLLGIAAARGMLVWRRA